MPFMISVRPAPTRPQKPTISPAWTSKLMSLNTPALPMPRTSSTFSPRGTSSLGYRSFTCRPAMPSIRSDMVMSATLWVLILRPSRKIVTRSAISKTSSSLWEMKMIDLPAAESRRMIL